MSTTTTSNVFVEMFGNELLLKGTEKVETDKVLKVGEHKAIGIYFSAHWCPPCRGFTPKLAEYYNKDLKNKGLEIVFVSSDRDLAAFDDYAKEQPWLSLPYELRDLKNKLSKKYKVRGIPSFVIIDGTTGELITLDGRGSVMRDPTGEDFVKTCWSPPTLKEIIGESFDKKNSNDSKKDVFEKISKDEAFKDVEAIGIYFSAHWCPPCKSFTPKLVDVYNKINKDKKRLEIIFCSADRDEKAFNEYFNEMPWLAVPYTDKKREEALSSHFDVSGIPCFVVLDAKDLSVINSNATGKVHGDLEGKNFPWVPESIKEIDDDPEGIDEGLSVVVLQENLTDDEKNLYKNDVLKIIANKYKGKQLKDNNIMFFCASKEGRLSQRVRDACNVSNEDSKNPKVVMMNIPEDIYYEYSYDSFTTENLEKFFESFKNDELNEKPMGA